MLGTVLDHFERREGKSDGAVVTDVLNHNGQLMVEAGTGTGKSMAYLLPAALHAINRGERVVVSTDTRALQEQLYQKDVPDVQTAVEKLGIPQEVRAAVLKGRNNYICLRRWFSHDKRDVTEPADASMRAKVALWLDETTRETVRAPFGAGRDGPLGRSRQRKRRASEPVPIQPEEPMLSTVRAARRKRAPWVANHSLLLADTVIMCCPSSID